MPNYWADSTSNCRKNSPFGEEKVLYHNDTLAHSFAVATAKLVELGFADLQKKYIFQTD